MFSIINIHVITDDFSEANKWLVNLKYTKAYDHAIVVRIHEAPQSKWCITLIQCLLSFSQRCIHNQRQCMSDSGGILKRRWAYIHSYINRLSSVGNLETEINHVIITQCSFSWYHQDNKHKKRHFEWFYKVIMKMTFIWKMLMHCFQRLIHLKLICLKPFPTPASWHAWFLVIKQWTLLMLDHIITLVKLKCTAKNCI